MSLPNWDKLKEVSVLSSDAISNLGMEEMCMYVTEHVFQAARESLLQSLVEELRQSLGGTLIIDQL